MATLERLMLLVTSLVLVSSMLVLPIGVVSAARGPWQSTGVNGGLVQQLATAGSRPTILYARTGNPAVESGSGIWKSADSGATWETTAMAVDEASGDDNVDLSAMAVSADGQTVYAASTNGPPGDGSRIWYSADGGASWDSTQVPSSSVQALAVLDRAGDRVVAGSANDDNQPLFYSDNGTTWLPAPMTGPQYEASIYTLAKGSTHYAGGNAYVPGLGWRSAVYTSTSGITWTLAFTSATVTYPFLQIVTDPSNAYRAYALVGWPDFLKYVYLTTDKGQHWEPTANQPPRHDYWWPPSSIAVDSQGRLYVAISDGDVYRSIDYGNAWGLVGQPADGKGISDIAVDPNDDNILYFGSYLGTVYRTTSPEGVYRTSANPQVRVASIEFGTANNGLHAYRASDVAGSAMNPNIIYAATHGQGLIKSTDGGETWRRASEGIANWADAVALDPSNTHIAYFAGGSMESDSSLYSYSIYRTEDGIVWEQRDTGLPYRAQLTRLYIDPNTPTTLYAVTNRQDGSNVFTTDNSGQDWIQVTTLPTPTSALAIHPFAPSILYAATDTTVLSPTGNIDAIYRTTDGGADWMRLPAGVSCVLDIIVNPTSPNEVYATGCNGVFLKSTNYGARWTTCPITPYLGLDEFPAGAKPGRLAFDRNRKVIYIALGSHGLVVSDDGGTTWSRLTGSRIPSMEMLSLHYQAQNGRLLLGGSAGLWKQEGTKVYLPIVIRP
jgi:photosystem II stability/assembly factor-like uncharacterized protein